MHRRTVMVVHNAPKKSWYRLSLRDGFEEVHSLDVMGQESLGFHIEKWLLKGSYIIDARHPGRRAAMLATKK